jgi:hypothetical protein
MTAFVTSAALWIRISEVGYVRILGLPDPSLFVRIPITILVRIWICVWIRMQIWVGIWILPLSSKVEKNLISIVL